MTTETLTLALPKQAGFNFRNFENDADYAHMACIAAALSDAEHLDFYPTPEWVNRCGDRAMTAVSSTTPNGMWAGQLVRLPATRRLAPGEAKPSLLRAVGTAMTGFPARNPAYLA